MGRKSLHNFGSAIRTARCGDCGYVIRGDQQKVDRLLRFHVRVKHSQPASVVDEVLLRLPDEQKQLGTSKRAAELLGCDARDLGGLLQRAV